MSDRPASRYTRSVIMPDDAHELEQEPVARFEFVGTELVERIPSGTLTRVGLCDATGSLWTAPAGRFVPRWTRPRV